MTHYESEIELTWTTASDGTMYARRGEYVAILTPVTITDEFCPEPYDVAIYGPGVEYFEECADFDEANVDACATIAGWRGVDYGEICELDETNARDASLREVFA